MIHDSDAALSFGTEMPQVARHPRELLSVYLN